MAWLQTRKSASLLAAILLIAVFFIFTAGGIEPTGAISPGDPGPKMFPVALSVVMIIGAAWLAVSSYVSPARGVSETTEPGDDETTQSSDDVDGGDLLDAKPVKGDDAEGFVNVVLLICGLFGYLSLLNILGFSLTTIAFAALLLHRLGSRFVASLIGSVALVLFVKIMFTTLFEVQLPEGYLEELLP